MYHSTSEHLSSNSVLIIFLAFVCFLDLAYLTLCMQVNVITSMCHFYFKPAYAYICLSTERVTSCLFEFSFTGESMNLSCLYVTIPLCIQLQQHWEWMLLTSPSVFLKIIFLRGSLFLKQIMSFNRSWKQINLRMADSLPGAMGFVFTTL